MANIITASRIIFSILLLLCPVYSIGCVILYLTAGFTDMIDGTIARKTNSVSSFGAKLDSIADVTFLTVCFIKFLPLIELPLWMVIWIILIGVVKGTIVVHGWVVYKKFILEHTIMNKITGFLLFILPVSISVIELKYSVVLICVVATLTFLEESIYIRRKYSCKEN